MSDESKQKTIKVITGVKVGFQKDKLTIQSSSLVFDEEGKLIELKKHSDGTVDIGGVAQ